MAYQDEIIIADGVTSTGLVAATEAQGGDAATITVEAGGELASGVAKAGGAIHGVYDAKLTDVTAETGAVIDLAYGATDKPATSGMTLRGENTNIAEGTLFYSGAAVTGYAIDGVLYGVTGDNWRFCVGEGMTVSGAVFGNGARIYGHENAVFQTANILQGGNLGLVGQNIGYDIVAGATGVAAGKATLQIYADAKTYRTTVSQGGQANYSGYGEDTTVLSGGKVTLRDGAVVSNLTVSNGGMMSMYGGTVSGLELFKGADVQLSGGVVSGGNFQSGAKISVSAGAVVEGGRTYGGNAANYDFNVYDGGVVSGVKISGGRICISGGEARNVIVDKSNVGMLVYSGAAYNTTVNNGWEIVYSNAAAYDTVVNAGDQATSAGGTVYRTIVRGGYLRVASAGKSYDATVSGGYMVVSSAGVASDTTIRGGYLLVASSGVARYTTVSGGYLQVNSKAVASGATISGGYMIVSSTGVAQDVNVLSGASFFHNAGAKVTNVTLAEGAVIKRIGVNANARLQGTSAGSAFDLNNGVLDGYHVQSGTSIGFYSSANVTNMTMDEGSLIYMLVVATNANLHAVSNGTAIDMTKGVIDGFHLQNGGAIYVSSGGKVTNLVVDEGATMSLTVAPNTVVNGMSAGSAFSYSDGVLDDYTLRGADVVYVSSGARTNRLTIYGDHQTVMTGAAAYDTLISGSGYQIVSNGTAYRTTISKGGVQHLRAANGYNGMAYDTVVNSGASMIVSQYGVASRALVSGGITTVGASAVSLSERAMVTVSNGGVMKDVVIMSGASINVLSGGVISNFYQIDSASMLSCYGGEINGGSALGTFYSINGKTGYTAFGRIDSGATIRNFTFTTDRGSKSSQGNTVWYQVGQTTTGGKRSYAIDVTVEKFARLQVSSATAERARIVSGGTMFMYNSQAIANDALVSGAYGNYTAKLYAYCGTVNDAVVGRGGYLLGYQSGAGSAVINRALVNPGGELFISGAAVATVEYNPWMGKITSSGGTITYNERNYDVYVGNATDGTVSRFNAQDDWEVGSGLSAIVYAGNLNDVTIGNGAKMFFSGGVVDGVEINAGGSGSATAKTNVRNLVINSGGNFLTAKQNVITNVTVYAGGYLNVQYEASAPGIYGTLTIDYRKADGTERAAVYSAFQNMTNITSRIIKASEEAADRSYLVLSRSGDADPSYNFTLDIGGNRYTYARGAAVINPLAKTTYSTVSSHYTSTNSSGTFNLYNMSLVTAVDGAYVIGAVDTAAALATNGETVNTTDKMARWTAATTADAVVNVAAGMNGGNAWLELDGVTLTKALYGTAENQAFAGAVNYKVNAGTTVKQLAAGAAKGGSVAAVNVTVEGGNFTNAFYAGGFGSVADRVKTDIADGSFATNVFAGALCNYRAYGTATTEGDIVLKVAGGEFSKCIYAGAAVMAGNDFAADAPVHTVEDITVELAGGTASGIDFCVYGGGYAAGTNLATNTTAAYEAEDVEITISGGTWGDEPRGGRGIFGGVYASGVIASVEEVEITITDGTVRNVYGGGWAQNGGTSIIREGVEITISGGSVEHVFGGGAYSSTSGGSTSVLGDVSITVAGGTINGNIYAGGQLENSTVAGDVTVAFTGDGAYTCGVYGYVTTPSATEGGTRTLDLSEFTGTLEGSIGGFDEIRFTTATAATLTAAANDVDNDEWIFDLAGTAGESPILTWQDGTFATDTVILNLDGATAPEAGWSIAAGLAGADTRYTVNWSFATYDLGLGEKIFGGDYDGYGLNVDGEGILKFSKLA